MQDHWIAPRRRSWVWAYPFQALLVVVFATTGRAQGKSDDWIWSVELRAEGRGESRVFGLSDDAMQRLEPDAAGDLLIGRFAEIREIDEFGLMPCVTLPIGGGCLGGSRLEVGAIFRPHDRVFTSGSSRARPRFDGARAPRIVRRVPDSARADLGFQLLRRGLEWRFSERWVAKIGGEWTVEKSVSPVVDDGDRKTEDRRYSVNLSFAVEI